MALGATARDVMRLVLGRGMSMAAAGIGLGLAAALALGRWVAGLLFGVGAVDPATFLAVTAILAAVAFAACWVPARRAALVDPVRALQWE
jgi:ABC-type antimicrobial peptide transport system permease subunit